MKEFHRGDFANRTGLAQAWTVKSVDRLFTKTKFGSWTRSNSKKQGRGPPGTQAPPSQVPGDTAKEKTSQTTTWPGGAWVPGGPRPCLFVFAVAFRP